MDYARPLLADRLAAAYVLGTLRGPARRRFAGLLSAHPALQDAVHGWQARLLPLADGLAPVAVPAWVWAGIEARLFSAAAAAPLRWWQRLGLWRGLSALAGVAVVALLVLPAGAPPPQAPIVVVLATPPDPAGAGGAGAARFVASLSPDGRALVLQPLTASTLGAAQALELWRVPAQGGPRSLGLVRADRATTLLLATSAVQGTAALAVSVEPAGGSPTGAPTGPVVSVGAL